MKLGETATRKKIRDNYYKLCRKWHPDKCKKPKKKCMEMMKRIIEAYKIITKYCDNYVYSFHEKEIKKYSSYEELWNAQYGDDALFGYNNNDKK